MVERVLPPWSFGRHRDSRHHHGIGTHPDLVTHMDEIEKRNVERLDIAAKRKRFQEGAYKMDCDALIYQAHCQYFVRVVLAFYSSRSSALFG